MKTKFILLGLSSVLALGLAACSDDDDNVSTDKVPEAYTEALVAKYPESKDQNVEWEQKGNYYVAEYSYNFKDMDVWFGSGATWAMTKSDLGKNMFFVPGDVNSAFAESEYGMGNTIEDIDFYERVNDSFYEIEVELSSDQSDVYLYYTPEGTLLKTSTTEIDITPTTVL